MESQALAITQELPVRGTVLIVDDDVETVEAMRLLLERQGYSVLVAHNGRDALHILTGPDPDPCVVLLDLRMPIMDGFQLLRVMRSYTRLRSIPVVVVTGSGPGPQLDGDIDGVVPKPFAAHDLLRAVERWRSEA